MSSLIQPPAAARRPPRPESTPQLETETETETEAEELPEAQPGRFVFGLWGDAETLTAAQRERWQAKTVPEMRVGLKLAKQLDATIYAIGQESINAIAAEESGLWINVLPHAPGNLWLAKLRIMRDALTQCDSIVWLDWDSRLLQPLPLPPTFWSEMQAKAPLQAKIRQYHRRKCYWRNIERHRGPGVEPNPRTCASGAFIYCRDLVLLDQVIKAIETHSGFDDQQAICYAIDRICGGWQGTDYWHQHFDPPWYTIGSEIFPCDEGKAVFTAK